jgi:DNA polymerase III subunit epsilon
MNFIAIDFETANSRRSSVCAIGLAIVEEGVITGSSHMLIRPDPCDFDPYNVAIHGITESMVQEAPRFEDIWSDLEKRISVPLVAHNASFDMSVLRKSLDQFEQPYPELDYFCTMVIAKVVWPEYEKYKLNYIASKHNIKFEHHNAEEDAVTCAKIAIEACNKLQLRSIYDFENNGIRIGNLYPGGYSPCGGPRNCKQRKTVLYEKIICINDNLKEQAFVFTGELIAMTRKKAMEMVLIFGGECHKNIKKTTTHLVIGDEGYAKYERGHKSGKVNKAELMIRSGSHIKIISESEFMQIICMDSQF